MSLELSNVHPPPDELAARRRSFGRLVVGVRKALETRAVS
jgi:hypothetical protein